jgi:hypothetical protein
MMWYNAGMGKGTFTIDHLYTITEGVIKMGKDAPWRERKNIVMLCKAVMKYAEGPGEIDTLVNEACDKLGDLVILMQEAHERALEEQAAAQEKYEQRRAALADVPKWLLRKVVLDYFKDHPEELPDDGDWSVLDNVRG